jgi:hypothetical protein
VRQSSRSKVAINALFWWSGLVLWAGVGIGGLTLALIDAHDKSILRRSRDGEGPRSRSRRTMLTSFAADPPSRCWARFASGAPMRNPHQATKMLFPLSGHFGRAYAEAPAIASTGAKIIYCPKASARRPN